MSHVWAPCWFWLYSIGSCEKLALVWSLTHVTLENLWLIHVLSQLLWDFGTKDTEKSIAKSLLVVFQVCLASGNKGISAHCIIMLFWTTGNGPFFFFQMIVMPQWFVNMTKTITWVLWINVNSGFLIFLYWNQCVFWGERKPLKTPALTQDNRQPTLFYSVYSWWWVSSFLWVMLEEPEY